MNKEFYNKNENKILALNVLEIIVFSSLFIIYLIGYNHDLKISLLLFMGSFYIFLKILIMLFYFHILYPILSYNNKHQDYQFNIVSDITNKINQISNDSNNISNLYFNGINNVTGKYTNIRLKNITCQDSITNISIGSSSSNNHDIRPILNENQDITKYIYFINISYNFKFGDNSLIENIKNEFIHLNTNQLVWPVRELIEIDRIGFTNSKYITSWVHSSSSNLLKLLHKYRISITILSFLFGCSYIYYKYLFLKNYQFKEIIIEKSLFTTIDQLKLDMNYNRMLYNIGNTIINNNNNNNSSINITSSSSLSSSISSGNNVENNIIIDNTIIDIHNKDEIHLLS